MKKLKGSLFNPIPHPNAALRMLSLSLMRNGDSETEESKESLKGSPPPPLRFILRLKRTQVHQLHQPGKVIIASNYKNLNLTTDPAQPSICTIFTTHTAEISASVETKLVCNGSVLKKDAPHPIWKENNSKNNNINNNNNLAFEAMAQHPAWLREESCGWSSRCS
jgi:hypothetical protein